MANLSDFLSSIAQMLGLKPSEAKRLELVEERLAGSKKTNVDRLEAIKDEIRELEARAVRKKKELDAAKGESRRLIVGEIERTFRDMDRLHSKETILARNVEKVSMALAKIQDVRAAKMHGIEEGHLDDIAMEAEEAFDDLKAADRAADGLERVKYEAPEMEHMDVEERMGDLEEKPKTKASEPGLSADAQRRLKELEMDE